MEEFMKKTVSFIMLSALIITSGIQAGKEGFLSDPINKWVGGFGLFAAGLLAYNHYKVKQNQEAANNASADQIILNKFIEQTASLSKINGLAGQVEQLHISLQEKTALREAINTYETAIADGELENTRQPAADLTKIVKLHLEKQSPILTEYYRNTLNRHDAIQITTLVGGFLFASWCFGLYN